MGKQFKCWEVDGTEKTVGETINIAEDTTVTAIWEAIEYNVTVTGGTASVGAGTPITKTTMGTTVTLTAGAAPSGQMFDKWEVVSGSITLLCLRKEVFRIAYIYKKEDCDCRYCLYHSKGKCKLQWCCCYQDKVRTGSPFTPNMKKIIQRRKEQHDQLKNQN
mgnify:CR=1 FL=1